MTTTYDLSAAVGRVRLLIPDTDVDAATWTDAEITGFLGLEANNVYWAAALALETAASNAGLSQGVAVRFADGTAIEDSSRAVVALLQRAVRLRGRGDAAEERAPDGGFAVAEVNTTGFAARRMWRNEQRRRRG